MPSLEWGAEAAQRDHSDPLRWLPDEFFHPPGLWYFDGNSLGLQSRRSREAVERALDAWAQKGVLGWSDASPAWFTWVEDIAIALMPLLGSRPGEVTLGASTTVMLHQMLATLYPFTPKRPKILLDGLAFPTDRYAVSSFLTGRGRDPQSDMIVVPCRSDSRLLSVEDILAAADDEVGLAVLPSVIFSTGQRLPMRELTKALRQQGVMVIWDLCHSAGLFPHELHNDNVDAAVFCTYKYLNGGPGSPAGAFLHERHWPVSPGLADWWGSDNERQFAMPFAFEGAPDAHALQMGTPSILALASLAGSVQLLAEAGIASLAARSEALTTFLDRMVRQRLTPYGATIVTPPEARGGHIAVAHPHGQSLSLALRARGVVPDFRFPDIIRLAPAPSTTRFSDCVAVVDIMEEILAKEGWAAFANTQETVL